MSIVAPAGSALVGETVTLEASADVINGDLDEIVWLLPGGDQALGSTVEVTPSQPGLYEVTVEITSDGEVLDTDETAITVFDPDDPTPDFLGYPDVFGDANDDGDLTLDDVLATARIAGGLDPVGDLSRYQGLDLDFDGVITPTDTALISQALAQGRPLPDALLVAEGPPGRRTTLISPELLENPQREFSIRIDGTDYGEPAQSLLGFTTFTIPLDLSGGPRPIVIELLADGAVVASHDFALEASPNLPADPGAELVAAFEDVAALQRRRAVEMDAYLDALGVGAADREVFVEMNEGIAVAFEDFVNEIRADLTNPESAEFAEVLLELMLANGLDEARAGIDGLTSPNSAVAMIQRAGVVTPANINDPNFVCDRLLPGLCGAQEATRLANDVLGTIAEFCSYLPGIRFERRGGSSNSAPQNVEGEPEFVQIIVVVRAGAAAYRAYKAAKKVCKRVTPIAEVVDRLNSALSLASPSLGASTRSVTGAPGETVSVDAQLDITAFKDVCSLRQQALQDLFNAINVNSLVGAVVKRGGKWTGADEATQDGLTRRIQRAIEFLSGDSRAASEIRDSLGRALEPVCSNLTVGLPLPADDVFGDSSFGEGDLAFDGATANYTCPAARETFTLTGAKSICDESQSVGVDIQCGGTTITIVWGDDGAANDDIFELQVPEFGIQQAPSTPSRRESVTFEAGPGDYTVRLVGRAAPDNIGTYFISATGGALSGDATSGDDLTQGRVKTFTLTVQ